MRSTKGQIVSSDPFLARVQYTKVAKSSRGPSSDNSAQQRGVHASITECAERVVRVAGGVS